MHTCILFYFNHDHNLSPFSHRKNLIKVYIYSILHPIFIIISVGFLLPLIESVPKYHIPLTPPECVSVSVQTYTEELLEGCEGGLALLEGRMLAFQREVESRNKKLMEAEVEK